MDIVRTSSLNIIYTLNISTDRSIILSMILNITKPKEIKYAYRSVFILSNK